MICEAVIIIGERIIQLMVREARKEDLDALLKLYLFLHEDSIPELNAHLEKTWYGVYVFYCSFEILVRPQGTEYRN